MKAAALLLIVWGGLVGSGCSSLAPRTAPHESALPPVRDGAWAELHQLRADDWFLTLDTGTEALRWRLRAIRSATRSLDVQSFLWSPDPVGMLIYEELAAAAARGVRVRLLLDDAFTMHEQVALDRLDAHENVSVRIYNPYRVRPDSSALREFFNLGEFGRINHRMHNKVLVVDGVAAIIGGRNLADEYFGYDPSFNFRDMELLTYGSHVSQASAAYDLYWNSPWSVPVEELPEPLPSAPPKPEAGSADDLAEFRAESEPDRRQAWQHAATMAVSGRPALYFDQPAGERPQAAEEAPVQLAQDLTELLDGAREEIWLISAYLIPTPELEAAIVRAEQRGVDVRILTNSLKSNNHPEAHGAYQNHVRHLLTHGVDLHEVRADAGDRVRHMQEPVTGKVMGLHAKVLIVDADRVFVGSCNLDPRSLRLNTEMGLVVHSEDLNAALRRSLGADFELANAWRVTLTPEGQLTWTGTEGSFPVAPDTGPIDRLEDWFLGRLPIDEQL